MVNYSRYRHSSVNLIILILALLASACSSSVRFASSDASSANRQSSNTISNERKKILSIESIDRSDLKGKREIVLSEAERWLGTPYCWGGESKDCADCSGFVMEVYRKAGILLPRTAAEQYKIGKYVPIGEAKTGDLIFFQKGEKISHVGIYVGNNAMLHASSSSGVIIQDLATFGNSPKFIGCRTIIK